MRTIFMIVLAIAMAGCVAPTTKPMQVGDVATEIEAKKQREFALQTKVEDELRLYRVSYRVRSKAVGLCPDSTYLLGMSAANKVSFGADFKEAAGSLYGMSDIVKVFYVEPGSPADLAGIKAGDVPTALNDWSVPAGEKAHEAYHAKLSGFLKGGKPLDVSILRGTEKLAVKVTPIKACSYPTELSSDAIVNAFADGEKVIITKGMMRFAKDDVELSLVVGHELAHNAMKHMSAKKTNYVVGSIFDIVAAAYGINTQGAFGNAASQAYSQDFEAEADYVGLYMIAAAGVDLDNAPQFWRRMAADHPAGINKNHASSHPATPQRFLALEQTVAEIKAKIAAGQPVQPDMKKK